MLRIFASLFVFVAMITVMAEKSAAFLFCVDRFQVAGNLPGNKIDEFDNGNLDGWYVDDGTVVESNGAAIIRSPGELVFVPWDRHLYIQSGSEIETNEFNIVIGNGNATTTSRWLSPLIPKMNQLYRMNADIEFFDSNSINVGTNEFYILVYNFSSTALADRFGVPSGLGVAFSRITRDANGESSNVVQGVSINSSDVKDVLLRLVFDDDNHQFEASFSLDGGATFQSPFSPFDIVFMGSVAEFDDWNLGATSFIVVPPKRMRLTDSAE